MHVHTTTGVGVGVLSMLPDVDFDHAAAAEAAEACRETARALRTERDERARGSAHALRHWTGHHAQRFDDVQMALDRDAAALVEQLEATARRIDEASDGARDEQRRRDRENADRRRHNERERQRAAEAARERTEAPHHRPEGVGRTPR